MKLRRFYYPSKVAKATGWSFVKAYGRMLYAKQKFNVSFTDYYRCEFYKRPETILQRKSQALFKKREELDNKLLEVATEKNLTIDFLKKDRLKFCELYRIGVEPYLDWHIYDLSESERKVLADTFRKQELMRANLINDIALVDRSAIDTESVNKKLSEYYDFLQSFIPNDIYKKLSYSLSSAIKDKDFLDENEIKKLAIDMEASRYILGLSSKEYLMFRLWEKTFWEKFDYVPNSIHTGMMLYINGDHLADLCNEKYDTYQVLKTFYNRDIIRIKTEDDYGVLVNFIQKHDKGVFKPLTQTKGEGVRLVVFKDVLSSLDNDSIREYAVSLLEEYEDYIFEELIIANDEFKAINPDSINTVRALVYNDGSNVKFDAILLRVGRLGSFVDNGSLGGILMNIDPNTGVVNTLGADQEGVFYDKHPDTGFVFTDYQLPAWEKAKEMLRNAAKAIGPGYVGWDITYDKRGEWVVVEANGTPQQYGIQSTTGKGSLPRFVNTVGDKAMEGFVKETKIRATKALERAKNNGVLK